MFAALHHLGRTVVGTMIVNEAILGALHTPAALKGKVMLTVIVLTVIVAVFGPMLVYRASEPALARYS